MEDKKKYPKLKPLLFDFVKRELAHCAEYIEPKEDKFVREIGDIFYKEVSGFSPDKEGIRDLIGFMKEEGLISEDIVINDELLEKVEDAVIKRHQETRKDSNNVPNDGALDDPKFVPDTSEFTPVDYIGNMTPTDSSKKR